MNIVLLEPEIPQNTGNIARTCACTGASLHLIEPLGFSLNEKYVARSGMDYWDKVELHRYICYEDFLSKNPDARIWYATTKGQKLYTEADFSPNDFVMFGKESAGIPEEILSHHHDSCLRIPMGEGYRSLNLANSVAIVLYEALRHFDFEGLELTGRLHHSTYLE